MAIAVVFVQLPCSPGTSCPQASGLSLLTPSASLRQHDSPQAADTRMQCAAVPVADWIPAAVQPVPPAAGAVEYSLPRSGCGAQAAALPHQPTPVPHDPGPTAVLQQRVGSHRAQPAHAVRHRCCVGRWCGLVAAEALCQGCRWCLSSTNQ